MKWICLKFATSLVATVFLVGCDQGRAPEQGPMNIGDPTWEIPSAEIDGVEKKAKNGDNASAHRLCISLRCDER